ncbi:MAG: acetyl-CoA carboxylase, partial [Hyphomicrobiales bacterium]
AQAAPSSAAVSPAATAAQPVQAARPAAAEPDSRPGLLAIKAPMNGTFYVAPSPGAPPFVVPGAQVKESDTIGIIEVMKLFNSIRAGVKGRVVEICVANEGQVKSGQTLAWIEPA